MTASELCYRDGEVYLYFPVGGSSQKTLAHILNCDVRKVPVMCKDDILVYTASPEKQSYPEGVRRVEGLTLPKITLWSTELFNSYFKRNRDV